MTHRRALTDVLCVPLVISTALHIADARAQDADAPEPSLNTVVVTARAGVETMNKVDASYAVTTINNESLRLDAPLGVADALKSVPGFWVESSGGEASANIRARGIPTEGFSAVGMQENGLPIQHDPGLGWMNADQSFRLDQTIERIEVVRGGPASMFSSNAPGGLVNFITRRPGDTPAGLLQFESSDYGLMRVDGWYGLPVGDWRVGFGGFYREDDGVRDPGYTANEGGQLRFAVGRDLERGAFNFDVKHINDNVIFYTGLPLTTDANGDVTGVPGIDAQFGTLAGPETQRVQLLNASGPFELDVGRGTDVELTQFTAQLNYQLPANWQLRNGLRYRESESSRIGLFPNTPSSASTRLGQFRALALANVPGAVDAQLRYVSAPDVVFDVNNQNGNGLVTDGSLRQVRVPLDEWVNDFRLMRNFNLGGQRHDVAIGVYLARVDESFQRYSATSLLEVRDNARLLNAVAVDATGNVLATLTDNGITGYGSEFANGTGDSTTYALYASDEWQITEQVRLDVGARFEKVSVEGTVERSAGQNLGLSPTRADDNVLTGTGLFDPFDRDFDDIGWTTGVNWQFRPTSGVFARYTSTFRLPNVGSFITNATATPVVETMDFIEAGYKYTSERVTLFATLFNTQYDSLGFTELVRDPVNDRFISRTAYTDTETLGVEIESTYYAAPWFDIALTATWQDPEYGTFRPERLENNQEVVDDFTGHRLVRIPRISYRVTPGLNLLSEALRLELDYEHFGGRYSDAANLFELPDYSVLNANARYKMNDQVSFYVHAENLTNEIGLTEGNPRAGQFVSGETSALFVGRPIYGRNYRFSLLWSF